MEVSVRSSASGAPATKRVRRLIGRAAWAMRDSHQEVSVLFCADRRMATLNGRWRRKKQPTDVLAFPAGERPRVVGHRRDSDARFLGDIVIAIPYASRQARRRGEPVAREIDRLLLHGYLHLLGYDHETDHGEMDALEARLRKRFGIAERVQGPRVKLRGETRPGR
ncbi:MAG TPA: rRNA maturation RNase YbeY [Thermoanaerobaculia bacterium]|jgi:rRNA maturation RNase YbeY|nr:rRNA maturation RNase YbeY [Thermoanaerobaculia bacterium]